jgi:cell division protein FtsB
MLPRLFHLLAPKALVLATLSLALWIGHVAAEGMERSKKIEGEVAALRSEAEKVEKDNRNLKERIDYFQTDYFQEEEAKKKLNYQNPEEKVVVVKPGIGEEKETKGDPVPSRAEPEDTRPNYEKWRSQFFD